MATVLSSAGPSPWLLTATVVWLVLAAMGERRACGRGRSTGDGTPTTDPRRRRGTGAPR